jgi:hypothetical protein
MGGSLLKGFLNDTWKGLDCHPYTAFRTGLSFLLVILSTFASLSINSTKNLMIVVISCFSA